MILHLAVTMLLVCLGSSALHGQADQPGPLRIGVAGADVTPEGPVWKRGHGADKPSEGVASKIVAQCIVFDNQQTRVALVAVDLVALNYRQLQNLRAAAAAAGIPEQHLMVNVSHNHHGPSLGSIEPDARNAQYYELFTQRTQALFEQAVADLQPAVLDYTVGSCTLGISRRQLDDTGVARYDPDPREPIDPDVPILRAIGPDGHVRAIIFGYACHPTSASGALRYLVGAEWPGYARDWVQAAYPEAIAMFLQGCGGEIKPRVVKPRQNQPYSGLGVVLLDERGMRAAIGYELGRAVVAALAVPPQSVPADRPIEVEQALKTPVTLGGIVELVQLPSKDDPTQPWETPWHISTLRVGDVYIFGSQGELLSAIGRRIKLELSDTRVWTNGYTHWGGGYLPDAASYSKGGYEVERSRFAPQAEDVVVRAAKRQIEHLRTSPVQTDPVEVCYP